MISARFGRKLGTRLILDGITKDGLLSFEFTRLVIWIDPIQNIFLLVLCLFPVQHSNPVAVGLENLPPLFGFGMVICVV